MVEINIYNRRLKVEGKQIHFYNYNNLIESLFVRLYYLPMNTTVINWFLMIALYKSTKSRLYFMPGCLTIITLLIKVHLCTLTTASITVLNYLSGKVLSTVGSLCAKPLTMKTIHQLR